MTANSSVTVSELQRPLGAPPQINWTPEEHAALRALLLNAKQAEVAATGFARRETFRATRSLLAAARALGFTVPALAEMLSVRDDSVKTRSNVIAPIPRSQFVALIPALSEAQPDRAGWGDQLEDPVQLLAAYLSVSYVTEGDTP